MHIFQLQCKNTKILSHLLFVKHFMYLTHLFVIWRYQPEQSFEAYEMANTQEDPEIPESYNVDILPPPEDRFTIKTLLYPLNTEPSPQSGTAVNICTSVLGEMHKKCREKWIKMSEWLNLADHHLITTFPSRCHGVCLQCGSCSGRAGNLVTVCPWSSLGGLFDSHHHCVETAAEQSQARLQGRVCSFTRIGYTLGQEGHSASKINVKDPLIWVYLFLISGVVITQ